MTASVVADTTIRKRSADHGEEAKIRNWAGLDVHAAKVITWVVDAESGEMTVYRLPGETEKAVAIRARLARTGAGRV